MNRKQFLKATFAAAGACSITNMLGATAAQRQKAASDVLELKPSVNMARLAMGTGSNGWGGNSNQTRQLGMKGLADLLQAGFDKGVTFWDSADRYGSHSHVTEALKHVSRETVTILTKTRATSAGEMKKDLDRFRRELGTDDIDILLLHCVTNPDWPKAMAGAMDVISKAQEAGIVKMHGVSCHSLGALKTAVTIDWVQVDLARINPAGASMDGKSEKVIPVLREMKKKAKR
jgi:predicted aldo/keto reductase-like oxidoreductase